ncbi:MAG TPA: thiolase family protein [Solirubrobacteraceae bacterium]|nr:thiolase family protein [Solirubrobacteraceae bacterium]
MDVIVAGAAAIEGGAASEAARLVRAVTGATLDEAGLDAARVSAVFAGCGRRGAAPSSEAVVVRLGLRSLGFRPPPSAGHAGGTGRVEHVTASAAEALHQAYESVQLGIDDVVLCIGLDQDPGRQWPPEPVLRHRTLAARRYLNRTGLTIEHLARVVAKNRRHGARRGVSRELTLAEILDDAVLDWPLTRPMVARGGLGAAALILTAPHPAVVRRRCPRIRASVLVGGGGVEPIAQAARVACRQAGISPDDLDCAEVADVTAAAELAAYEQLGWAVDGNAGDLVRSGFTALGGVLPVNPSGGLLCLGERPGTSAIAQVVSLAAQLRGLAGAVQVPGAGVALAQSAGRPQIEDDGEEDLIGLTLLTA